MHFLVVDDNHDSADSLGELLRMLLEAKVGVVYSGADAVAAAGRTDFDAMVTDIEMPGMDGIAAAGHIRSLPHPPRLVIAVSGVADSLPTSDLSVFDRVLVKPVDIDMLVGLLEAA